MESQMDVMVKMLEVSASAQILMEENRVAALSPPARKLLRGLEPGTAAETLLGSEELGLLEDLSPGSSCYLSLCWGGLTYDAAAVFLEGARLLTLESEAESRTAATLTSIAEQIRLCLSVPGALREDMLELLPGDRVPNAMRLNRSYYRLMRIAENIRYYAEDLPPERMVLDLREGMAELELYLTPLVREAKRELELEIPARACPVLANWGLVRQVLLQLVSNSIKFTEPGGTIRISLRRRDHRVRLSVRDNGCGIPEDQMAHTFTRVEHRGPVPDPRWGVGIGLPMARRLLQAQDARLLMRSEAGIGTVFHLDFPVASGRVTPLFSVSFSAADTADAFLMSLSDALPAQVYDPRDV